MIQFHIYCDGSYRDRKSGFGIKILNPKVPNIFILAFGSHGAGDSYEGELIAIEKALLLIRNHISSWLNDKEYEIQIMSDCKTIVDVFKTGAYKKINKSFNKINDLSHIKKNKVKLFEIIKTVSTFPDGSISFKCKKKKNMNIKTAHRFARFALNNSYIFDNEFCFCQQDEMKKVLNLVTPVKNVNEIDVNIIKNLLEAETETDSKVVEDGSTEVDEKVSSMLVPVNKIFITENDHLDCISINLNGLLRKVSETGEVINPIFVKKVQGKDSNYRLVSGAAFLFTARILGLEKIPAIQTELTLEEFKTAYKI